MHMIIELLAPNVPEAYVEAWWAFRTYHPKVEESRNGKVRVLPHPVVLTIGKPDERVLLDPVRDANPFFHVMEFVWMLAGSNDAVWISQFNKRMMTYADEGYLRGAYGWRWTNPNDQIASIITLLRREPSTRQAVLSMWDPLYDGPEARTSDRPCNTHIYFGLRAGKLDMTVMNRSNDLVWGMLGANAVHMTFLHELVARASGIPMGNYQVFTKNLHVYLDVPRYDELTRTARVYDIYRGAQGVRPYPLLSEGESWVNLRQDCRDLLAGEREVFRTQWMTNVALPMYHAYLNREHRNEWLKEIKADDWRRAASEWADRRNNPGEGDSGSVQG